MGSINLVLTVKNSKAFPEKGKGVRYRLGGAVTPRDRISGHLWSQFIDGPPKDNSMTIDGAPVKFKEAG